MSTRAPASIIRTTVAARFTGTLNTRSNASAPTRPRARPTLELGQHSPQHEPDDLTALRTECDTQPELSRPPLDGVAGHRIQPDQRQHERDDGNASDEDVAESSIPERVPDRLLERHHAIERQIRVETGDFLAQPANDTGPVRARPHENDGGRTWVRPERQEHDRIGFGSDDLLTHGRGDADDLRPGRIGSAPDANARADRFLPREKHLNKTLVHDRRFGARPSVS